ncbi:hypothetical protein [Haladaptatus salinisoli]|uniref:hypothetical protein n=1 Tax=Haladaptatus salinisoli TaxID=2884876 RepID=UPI001D0A8796|nr:hypothetical protein [Haladaptatus salinisoli]
MTHNTTIVQEENSAVYKVVVRLDVTALDAAGVEQFDPTTETDDTRNKTLLEHSPLTAVNVLEWEDETSLVMWDTVDEELKVKALADGTDVASGTALGEVLVEVRGE